MSTYLYIWLNVINAILIRDVKVRSGLYFSGYIFVFLLPFLHLATVIIIFTILERVAPFGNDRITYYGLSILPFVIFTYPSQQIMRSISSNAPLLYFSRVKFLDVVIARGILETLNGLLVSALVLLVIKTFSGDFNPENPFLTIYALLCTLLFGFAFGSFSSLIAQILPMWSYAMIVAFPAFWMLSGIIFYPHALPESYSSYLQYNPLLRCVEALRYSYYVVYPDIFSGLDFVIWISIFLLCSSVIFERIGRRILISA